VSIEQTVPVSRPDIKHGLCASCGAGSLVDRCGSCSTNLKDRPAPGEPIMGIRKSACDRQKNRRRSRDGGLLDSGGVVQSARSPSWGRPKPIHDEMRGESQSIDARHQSSAPAPPSFPHHPSSLSRVATEPGRCNRPRPVRLSFVGCGPTSGRFAKSESSQPPAPLQPPRRGRPNSICPMRIHRVLRVGPTAGRAGGSPAGLTGSDQR
jgi:hypothetical protein